MAIKNQDKERVQNYPSIFPELEGGISYEKSLNAPKKPRRRVYSPQMWRKDKELTSRARSNKKLWDSLYPTPKR